MRNILKYFVGVLTISMLLASCEKNDPILFQQGDSFVAFNSPTISVSEPNTAYVLVQVVTTSSTPVTVNFDFSTEGISAPAIEGEAFTLLNASKTLTFSNGIGYDTIKIRTIDDDEFTGNRSTNIVLSSNSAGYKCGGNIATLTILDEEHPLGPVIGTFNCNVESRYDGVVNRTISVEPVDGDLTMVKFRLNEFITSGGIFDDQYVYVNVDLDNNKFNWVIAGDGYPTQGDDWGAFSLLTTTGSWQWHDDWTSYPGTIEYAEDGTVSKITFSTERGIGALIGSDVEDANSCYDYFYAGMVWTKQ